MSNEDIAKKLRNVAACYELKGDYFRKVAYERASDTVSKLSRPLEDFWKEGRLDSVPGIGKSIAGHLNELFEKGNSFHFESVCSDYPHTLFDLLDLPGFGPKKALKLVSMLKLEESKDVKKDLFRCARTGKIALLKGFGPKSQEQVLSSIAGLKKGIVKERRMELVYAVKQASEIESYLKQHDSWKEVSVLGSLRRMNETVGDLDIAVASEKPESVTQYFLRYKEISNVIEKGPHGASVIMNNGIHVDLRVIDPSMWGSMVQYFTGSKNHNIKLREYAIKKGLSLSEYGIKPDPNSLKSYSSKNNFDREDQLLKFRKEEDFYRALDLQYIPPEIREGTDEIELSKKSGLPELVRLEDMKGDLHVHSDYRMASSHDLGVSGIREVAEKAASLGYSYIGFSDHNPAVSKLSENEIINVMRRRKRYYEQFLLSNLNVRIKILNMCEIDINPDGRLALPDKAFDFIDAAIASVHSSFRMDRDSMTNRIIKAISHPKVRILGHPTGRIIGHRASYDLDWGTLFSFMRNKGVAAEINAYPDRLDLNSELAARAVSSGVMIAINTDSHAADQMDYMHWGVSVARRGRIGKKNIINTFNYDKIREWLIKP